MDSDRFTSQLDDIRGVLNNGGWALVDLDADLIDSFQKKINLHSKILFNVNNYLDLSTLLRKTPSLVSEIFDSLNQSTLLCEVQHRISEKFLQNVMVEPVMWTYPNIRIDFLERGEFLAPPHVDDWILFRGHSNLIFWTSFFSDAYLDICPVRGHHEIEQDEYWGIRLVDNGEYGWQEIKVPRGKILIFCSDLLHRSSKQYGDEKLRISAQFRYEDLSLVSKPYKRAMTQKISEEIRCQQKQILKRKEYNN